MEYYELRCNIKPAGDFNEIIIAYLSSIGFSMFEENPDGLNAYILKEDFIQSELDQLPIFEKSFEANVNYSLQPAENKNWNAIWEAGFDPVTITDKVAIRAEHHPKPANLRYDLVITPRMSFGTGHHSTTFLMVKKMLDIPFKNKKVLDMGAGTAILGIFAEKLGALSVDCVDIDANAVDNALDNLKLNKSVNISVKQGNAHELVGNIYDVVLANINRNIILDDLPLYERYLKDGGSLLISGFYVEDLEKISQKAEALGFFLIDQLEKKNWCCALFKK